MEKSIILSRTQYPNKVLTGVHYSVGNASLNNFRLNVYDFLVLSVLRNERILIDLPFYHLC